VSQVTTHVLDTAAGRPAARVAVTLERADGTVLATGATDPDGRVRDLGPDRLDPGTYRLRFDTGTYLGSRAFFPEVVIVFRVNGDAHHHVPLLLSPFGYSTYRGS
jgi:5-hydroxyisourate hydrolase